MLPEPLHPMVVHFPIVFVSLLPLVAVAVLIMILRDGERSRAWTWVVVLAAMLAGSSWVALQTGEAQEEVVEEVVARDAIHEHEEAGERFFWLSVVMFGIAAVGLVRGPAGRAGRAVATLAAFGLLAAGVQVGGSGGDLVYEHGAASAYVDGSGDSTSDEAHEDRERTGQDDDSDG